MSRIDRDAVVAALRAEDVANHIGIKGQWRGRWMRANRCGEADHATDAFGISRDGHWHCWACDKGGDLLRLLALSERIDIVTEFPKLLEVAAAISGIDDDNDFGAPAKPTPRVRPELPPPVPIAERIHRAKHRAAWVWERLYDDARVVRGYLKSRGIDGDRVMALEDLRTTPMKIARPDPNAKLGARELFCVWQSFKSMAIVIPVRAADDGRFVDLRARRTEPTVDQPKIIGLLGGVTAAPQESGRGRALVGCYGRPHTIDSDLVVIVEGALDYLTALVTWPNAQVLGAVEAGSLSLVAAHAARQLALRDDHARLIIVEQYDRPRTLRDGRVVAGAADAAINEDPNAAMKVAVRILGPRRVGWLFCGVAMDQHIKDLNDLVANGHDARGMVRWPDLESPTT